MHVQVKALHYNMVIHIYGVIFEYDNVLFDRIITFNIIKTANTLYFINFGASPLKFIM